MNSPRQLKTYIYETDCRRDVTRGRLPGRIPLWGPDVKAIGITPFAIEHIEKDPFSLDDGRCLNPYLPLDRIQSEDVGLELGLGRPIPSCAGDPGSSASFDSFIGTAKPAHYGSFIPVISF